MTNYRMNGCLEHDKPQFKFCFDCGAPLRPNSGVDSSWYECSRVPIHFKIWFYPHGGDLDNDLCAFQTEFI